MDGAFLLFPLFTPQCVLLLHAINICHLCPIVCVCSCLSALAFFLFSFQSLPEQIPVPSRVGSAALKGSSSLPLSPSAAHIAPDLFIYFVCLFVGFGFFFSFYLFFFACFCLILYIRRLLYNTKHLFLKVLVKIKRIE